MRTMVADSLSDLVTMAVRHGPTTSTEPIPKV